MFDETCYNLAAEFLEDHPDPRLDSEANRNTIAQAIQDVIEAEIYVLEERLKIELRRELRKHE